MNDLSIKIIKLCGKSIAYLFKLIFEAFKNLVKNYRPISPILRNFWKSDFQGLVDFLHKN